MPASHLSVLLSPTRGEIVVSAEAEGSEWDAFVETHPDSTVYHLWRWRSVFEHAFGHRSVYLAARNNGVIVGVLPLVLFDSWVFGRFIVSLPFVNYGGVVADDPAVAESLLDHAAALAVRGSYKYLELRHRRARFDELAAKRHKVAMLLDLPLATDVAWAGLDRKVRNQIRKAEKSGLTVSIGGAEKLNGFYDLFARNSRDLGTPVYGRAFFEAVLDAFHDSARIFVVHRDSTPMAAGISLSYRTRLEVPWAASARSFLSLCPNNLLYWAVIQQAIAQRIRVLDFGRSTPNEGTFHFKRQWGAEPHPLCWEYRLCGRRELPDLSPKNPKYRAAISVWKRLPIGVATALGPRIVRSIP